MPKPSQVACLHFVWMLVGGCTGSPDELPGGFCAHSGTARPDSSIADAGAGDTSVDSGQLDEGHDAGPPNPLCPLPIHFRSDGSLHELGRAAGVLVGTAVSSDAFVSDPAYASVLRDEYSFVTPENVMKWGSIEPRLGEANFDAADAFVRESCLNGQAIRGHALVWHAQAPDGITALGAVELQANIDRHIDETVGRYRGIIRQWDVVNEAVGDLTRFRRSHFFETLGIDYIANAFRRARAADPDAELGYNDYGITGPGPKSDRVYELIRELVADGVPVDYVGIQAHERVTDPLGIGYTEEELRANLARFTDLGVDVYLTEVDVQVAGFVGDAGAAQREAYRRLVSACVANPRCRGITTWGFTDKHSWIDAAFGEDDPLLFDEAFARKPAYYGFADGLARRPSTGPISTCSSDPGEALICEGFEVAAGWDVTETDGALRYERSARREGSRGLRASLEGTGPGPQALLSTALPSAVTSGSLFVKAHVRLDTSSANLNTLFAATSDIAACTGVAFGVAAGTPEIYAATASRRARGGSISLGEWHCVELRIDVGPNGGGELFVDDVSQVTMTATNTLPPGGLSRVSVGVLYSSNDRDGTVSVDDFIVSRTRIGCR